MTPGRHVRRPTRRAYQLRAALGGFAVVAVCAAAIGVVASAQRKSDLASSQITTTTAPVAATTVVATSTTPVASTTSTTPSTTTSTVAARARTASISLKGKVVVIDPGHNGGNGSHPEEIARQVPAGGFTKECDTTGTQTNDGYPEHSFTWDVANRAAQVLRSQGATVYLTRPDDSGVGPCVDERAASGANRGADVAISIHADGGPAGGRGFHVMPPAGCSGCDNAIVAPSASLARDLRDAYLGATNMPTSTYLGSNGIMARSDLAGINLSAVPKVFIECGNMRNATDAALLSDPSFRQDAANGIALGITSYLGSS